MLNLRMIQSLTNAKKVLNEQGFTPVIAGNLDQLAANVAQKAENEGCECIRDLVIVGHGDAGEFSVGSGCGDKKANKHISLANKLTCFCRQT